MKMVDIYNDIIMWIKLCYHWTQYRKKFQLKKYNTENAKLVSSRYSKENTG